MEVQKEKVITDIEARDILDNREKEGELKYEQKNALDILRKFVEAPPEKVKELVKELPKISKLRERHIIALANFLPEDKDELRAVFHKDYNIFTEDEINLILETVKKLV